MRAARPRHRRARATLQVPCLQDRPQDGCDEDDLRRDGGERGDGDRARLSRRRALRRWRWRIRRRRRRRWPTPLALAVLLFVRGAWAAVLVDARGGSRPARLLWQAPQGPQVRQAPRAHALAHAAGADPLAGQDGEAARGAGDARAAQGLGCSAPGHGARRHLRRHPRPRRDGQGDFRPARSAAHHDGRRGAGLDLPREAVSRREQRASRVWWRVGAAGLWHQREGCAARDAAAGVGAGQPGQGHRHSVPAAGRRHHRIAPVDAQDRRDRPRPLGF
mmetsp:Transcript_52052/g.167103  ORF Transcript_52052/g.167103 Transcript_52052/m.167103 type:complete len:276 (+) Transcript_52052:3690-4517(+)